jgi:hypothetical protein
VVTPLVSALLDGTANAFLTLRIGLIASQYGVPLTRLEMKPTRGLAASGAAKLLGGIVMEGTQSISRVITQAAGKKIVSAGSALADKTKQRLQSL